MCNCTGCFDDLHASITMDVLAPKMNMFEKSRNYNTHNFSTTCSASAQVEFFSYKKHPSVTRVTQNYAWDFKLHYAKNKRQHKL